MGRSLAGLIGNISSTGSVIETESVFSEVEAITISLRRRRHEGAVLCEVSAQ
jgi:hypothetical protein